MRLHLKWVLFAAICALLFIFASFRFQQHENKESVPINHVPSNVSIGYPIRLIIPSLNVDANIQQVGVSSNGEMEVPSAISDVGWFKLGSRPGEKGNAVISGHFDGRNSNVGVFYNLHKLKKGNKISILDDKGNATFFIVRESRLYDPGYAEEVFSGDERVQLTLITCDGVWDGTKKSYSKRLVVFADIVH